MRFASILLLIAASWLAPHPAFAAGVLPDGFALESVVTPRSAEATRAERALRLT